MNSTSLINLLRPKLSHDGGLQRDGDSFLAVGFALPEPQDLVVDEFPQLGPQTSFVRHQHLVPTLLQQIVEQEVCKKGTKRGENKFVIWKELTPKITI